jgi:hypothetical protein
MCSLPDVESVCGLGDAGLVDVMRDAAPLESAITARKFAAAAELYRRRLTEQCADDREQWCIDGWEEVAAEVAAAQGISRGRAAGQLRYGIALAERLPKLGALFAAGEVDFRNELRRLFTVAAPVTVPPTPNEERMDTDLARRLPKNRRDRLQGSPGSGDLDLRMRRNANANHKARAEADALAALDGTRDMYTQPDAQAEQRRELETIRAEALRRRVNQLHAAGYEVPEICCGVQTLHPSAGPDRVVATPRQRVPNDGWIT